MPSVIVVFGASSDIGRRSAARLLDDGFRLRLVARDPSALDRRAERIAGDLSSLAALAGDADTVVSCAHARFVPGLLDSLPPGVTRLVLVGSAWRYSRVPNQRADQVRAAEASFLASGRNGVMLHPTMIYGGWQEHNLRRLLRTVERLPIVLAPGGGRHLVQPVYVDDVAACIVAAAKRAWDGPHVIPVAGPAPMPWRDMVSACARATRRAPLLLPVPLGPVTGLLALIERTGLRLPVTAGMLHRFREDVCFSTSAMENELGVKPQPFELGLSQALAQWNREPGEGSNASA